MECENTRVRTGTGHGLVFAVRNAVASALASRQHRKMESRRIRDLMDEVRRTSDARLLGGLERAMVGMVQSPAEARLLSELARRKNLALLENPRNQMR